MVILLGSVVSDPGVIVNRDAPALCQVADTGNEKVQKREKPYDVGHSTRGWPP